MITRRGLMGASAVAGAMGLWPFAVRAEGAPGLLDELYRPDATADVALSPRGDRIAVLRNQPRGNGVTGSWIELVDLSNPGGTPGKVVLGAHEASAVTWANDRRLLVWMVYDVTAKGAWTEKIVRIISLLDDGSQPVVLFGNRGTALRYIHDLGTIVDHLPDDPDNVMMVAWEPLRGLPALHRVNVNTGVSTVVEYGALRTGTWITQGGVPLVRLDSDRRGASLRIMTRSGPGVDYRLMRSIPADQLRDFDIFGPTERPGVFLGSSREGGEDKMAIREVELASMTMGAPLHPVRGVDVEGIWRDSRGRMLAVTWIEEKRVYDFVDKSLVPHLAAIERHFGPESSIELRDVDETRNRLLGVATGPRMPGVFFAYDRTARSLVELGARAPTLTPERLGRTEALDVKTRDGATVRAYLTAPPSGAPGPLIVVPHGGPETRDSNGYDLWGQAFAAKGWWVLKVNFRGSGGYGLAFAQAGWRRWGDRMQEDIEDAVDQVVSQRGLDAKRIAIVGGSYGGYAALMGAVRRPDQYRAVVSMAGVSDLIEMLKWELKEDETPDKFRYGFWRERIGDPKTDAETLKRASPRLRASEIKAPVLLVHGTWDGNVPFEQSKMMAEALKKAGKPYEYVEQKRVGHSPETPAADREMLMRVITFVEKAFA